MIVCNGVCIGCPGARRTLILPDSEITTQLRDFAFIALVDKVTSITLTFLKLL